MLASWMEDRINELGEMSLDSQAQAWKRIAIVGELVDSFPPRSPERKELTSLIANVARIKRPTQLVYAKLWRMLKENAPDGEIRLPRNIDASTVRCLVEHGADYATICHADEDSWTLAQARLWAQDKAKVATDKPLTLWKYLTKRVPPHMRKATSLEWEDKALAAQTISALVKEFNQTTQED